MSITRFAVLPDERRLLMGVDKLNLFEAGYVYEAFEMLDEIVIRKVGKYSLTRNDGFPNENSDANQIISMGFHNLLMTEEELSKVDKNKFG